MTGREGKPTMSEYLLELKSITKTFPGVKALDNVSFTLKKGQIHALMGENGAGKSTFIKVITGVHKPDSGEIILRGEPVSFNTPKESTDQGIAAIYQHVTCYPDLSVTENIFLGHELVKPGSRKLMWNEMHKQAKSYLERLGTDIDPRAEMGSLSVAQQQIIEIAKALSTDAEILIMDEPTAALTKRESEELYRMTEQLRDEGKGIIFISHRFEDMYRLASDVTVLRDAKYIGSWKVDEISNHDLIIAMVGRELVQMYPPSTSEIGKCLFTCEDLGKTGYFKDVTFNVRAGEIVALTGLVGAGRSELSEAIAGVWPYDEGKLTLEGVEIHPRSPREAMNLGIGFLPEDRQKQGLLLDWSIERNITLATLEKYKKGVFLNESEEWAVAEDLSRRITVKAPNIAALVSSLSGGNQQKVVVAKLLASDLKLIIMDEPTKGVDVGAKYAIYEIMREMAAQGLGIVMISSEMPEVLGMADRIVVMREGRVTTTLNADEASQESILAFAMAARHGEGEKEAI